MERVNLFIGADEREAVGIHVFLESLWKHTSIPVSLTVLTPQTSEEVKTDGTNAFSKSRFLVPYLCGFQGWAIWLDGADMLLRSDLADLWNHREPGYGVKVVKHAYQTKYPKKYVGTSLESDNQDYPRKNWSSVVLWHCGYFPHRKLTPEFIAESKGSYLHRFSWLEDDQIGNLPAEWNHLVGEYKYNPQAKLAHYTLGLPGFEHYRRSDYATEWTNHLKAAARGLQYLGK